MTDPFSAAIHEMGHALTQAVLNVGPQWVKIYESNGQWWGQSLPSQGANDPDTHVRLLVTQLAGPIAQIVAAHDSLEDLRDHFEFSLLKPAMAILDREDRPLDRLGWEGDLTQDGLHFVINSVLETHTIPFFYEDGGFLFSAESLLFRIFRGAGVNRHLKELAQRLAEQQIVDGADFLHLAKDAIAPDAWKELLALDLDFPSPITLK